MRAIHSSRSQVVHEPVDCTAQLSLRPRRQPDYEAENRALVSLAQVLADPPRDILQRLTEAAVTLCKAGSSGISIIEEDFDEKVFRWHALTGALAPHKWGTTPRDFSPCGTVIERNATQLMHLPEREFPYLANVKPQVVEVLLVPFSVHAQPVGTIWVVSHSEDRRFDAEDARLVEELGQMASKAYQLASSVAASQNADRRKDELLAALARELRGPPYTPTDVPGFRLQGMSECQQRVVSMKHMINELLERSRIRPEADGTASGSISAIRPAGHMHPATRVTGSVPLPRGAVHDDSKGGTLAGSLLQRMRRGDQRALEELYDSTVDTVYALAQALLRSQEDAEEVVCDTYAQAWRQSERFDANRATPIGWLLMMCRGRALDRLRHNRCRRAATTVSLDSVCELAHDALTPEDLLALFHDGSRVQRALAALSPQRLKLVGLAFFEGLSFPEIAAHTGLPLGTVKSHIRRAIAELRRDLQKSESP